MIRHGPRVRKAELQAKQISEGGSMVSFSKQDTQMSSLHPMIVLCYEGQPRIMIQEQSCSGSLLPNDR